MVTRAWKVYGAYGHRQRESFNPSYEYDFSQGDNIRKISVENSDKTGTNEYTIIRITRNTSDECVSELDGQLSDGIFESSRTGSVVEIYPSYSELSQEQIAAIEKAAENIGVDTTADNLERYYKDTTITLNIGRNDREVAWIIFSDSLQSCVYVDTLEELTEEEIKEQLL